MESNNRLVRFCLEIQMDENDALACAADDLESGKVQIYEAYLERVLGIQCKESLSRIGTTFECYIVTRTRREILALSLESICQMFAPSA